MQNPVVAVALILLLGVGAQWLARAIWIPSILVLLAAGLVAGPVTGLVDPEAVFGDLLSSP